MLSFPVDHFFMKLFLLYHFFEQDIIMNRKPKEWKSIKVPQNLHNILKWLALQKNKRIYQVLAELIYMELKGEKHDCNN